MCWYSAESGHGTNSPNSVAFSAGGECIARPVDPLSATVEWQSWRAVMGKSTPNVAILAIALRFIPLLKVVPRFRACVAD
jgi:hypothetical protein